MSAADQAVSGSANTLLTGRQRSALAQLARKAYVNLSNHGLIEQDFDSWRREQCIAACGLRITEASNRHYLILESHFYNLMGRTDLAFKKVLKQQTEARGWAIQKLFQECTKAKLSLDYPRAIARDKFKTTDLETLTDKQLWHLVFSVRRRQQKNNAAKTGGQKSSDVVAAVLGHMKARMQQ